MIKAYEMTGELEFADNSPIALAVRWLDATEAEISGEDIEGQEQWQRILDRVETVAKVDPAVLLHLARLQQVNEETPDHEGYFPLGNLMQLGLLHYSLNERAAQIEETLSSATFPIV